MSLYYFPALFSLLFLVTLAPFKLSAGINECNFHTLTSPDSRIMAEPIAVFNQYICPLGVII